MKHLLLLPLLLMVACTTRPSVSTTNPDGSITKITLGGTFMAEADEVVAEIEAPGPYHLRYAAKREDSTRVPIAGLQALVSKWLAGFSANTEDLKTVTDGRVALGAQRTEVAKETIKAGVSGATVFNPNIPLPIRR